MKISNHVKKLSSLDPTLLNYLFNEYNIDSELNFLEKLELLSSELSIHSSNMNSSLPYNGNIMEAIRNQDRDAIRTIQSFRDSQQVRPSPDSPSLEPEYVSCQNTTNFIGDKFDSESNPVNIRLFVYNSDQSLSSILCYNARDLKQWYEDGSNYFANWIPNSPTRPISNEGYGGHPGKYLFLKLPPYNLYLTSYTKILDHMNLFESDNELQEFVVLPIQMEQRIGNREGVFGISQIHGQAPGYTIYRVFLKVKDVPIVNYFQMAEYLQIQDQSYDQNDTAPSLITRRQPTAVDDLPPLPDSPVDFDIQASNRPPFSPASPDSPDTPDFPDSLLDIDIVPESNRTPPSPPSPSSIPVPRFLTPFDTPGRNQ